MNSPTVRDGAGDLTERALVTLYYRYGYEGYSKAFLAEDFGLTPGEVEEHLSNFGPMAPTTEPKTADFITRLWARQRFLTLTGKDSGDYCTDYTRWEDGE